MSICNNIFVLNCFQSLQDPLISGFGCVKLQQSKQPSKECLEVVPINKNMLILYPSDNHSRGSLKCSPTSVFSSSWAYKQITFPRSSALRRLGHMMDFCPTKRVREDVRDLWVCYSDNLPCSLYSFACKLERGGCGKGPRGRKND